MSNWTLLRGKKDRLVSEAKAGVDPVADFKEALSGQRFATVLADPPWQFINRTGKVAPEHRRLSRYETMGVDDICRLPLAAHAQATAHLYLWVPNALLPDGLRVMQAWEFTHKSNIVWHKLRKDDGSDERRQSRTADNPCQKSDDLQESIYRAVRC